MVETIRFAAYGGDWDFNYQCPYFQHWIAIERTPGFRPVGENYFWIWFGASTNCAACIVERFWTATTASSDSCPDQ